MPDFQEWIKGLTEEKFNEWYQFALRQHEERLKRQFRNEVVQATILTLLIGGGVGAGRARGGLYGVYELLILTLVSYVGLVVGIGGAGLVLFLLIATIAMLYGLVSWLWRQRRSQTPPPAL